MNCHDCQERLQAELDGEAFVSDPALEGHLAACAECRQLQASSRRLQHGLRLFAAPAVPPELASRLVAAVLSDRRQRQQRRRLIAGAFALAASVLITAWVGAVWNRTPERDRNGGRVNREQEPRDADLLATVLAATQELSARTVASLPKVPAIEPIQSTVSDATSAVTDLTSHTVDATMARTKVLLPTIEGSLLPPMDDASPLEPATASLMETGQSVTAGFEPVANSARRAFSLFRRDLPALPGSTPGL